MSAPSQRARGSPPCAPVFASRLGKRITAPGHAELSRLKRRRGWAQPLLWRFSAQTHRTPDEGTVFYKRSRIAGRGCLFATHFGVSMSDKARPCGPAGQRPFNPPPPLSGPFASFFLFRSKSGVVTVKAPWGRLQLPVWVPGGTKGRH